MVTAMMNLPKVAMQVKQEIHREPKTGRPWMRSQGLQWPAFVTDVMLAQETYSKPGVQVRAVGHRLSSKPLARS